MSRIPRRLEEVLCQEVELALAEETLKASPFYSFYHSRRNTAFFQRVAAEAYLMWHAQTGGNPATAEHCVALCELLLEGTRRYRRRAGRVRLVLGDSVLKTKRRALARYMLCRYRAGA